MTTDMHSEGNAWEQQQTNAWEPQQTIIFVEDCADSSHGEFVENLANFQQPDSEGLPAPSLTSLRVESLSETPSSANVTRQHWQPESSQCCGVNHGGETPVECAACARDVVRFLVGRDQQLLVGSKALLAAVSEVFKAMFFGAWPEYREDIRIPDVSPQAFAVLLRHAAGDGFLDLDDDNVWEVLRVSDRYLVTSLVDVCFHYLLHGHRSRKKSSHICRVLETSHQGIMGCNYERCLQAAKHHAGRIFRNESAVRTLCYGCMLKLVKADDLRGADESLVHRAVVTWARSRWRSLHADGSTPDRKQLRAAAGDLVLYVRYLAMDAKSRARLLQEPSAHCLLDEEERRCLLERGVADAFPPDAQLKLGAKRSCRPSLGVVCGEHVSWRCVGYTCFLVSLTFLVVFAVVSFVIYIGVHAVT